MRVGLVSSPSASSSEGEETHGRFRNRPRRSDERRSTPKSTKSPRPANRFGLDSDMSSTDATEEEGEHEGDDDVRTTPRRKRKPGRRKGFKEWDTPQPTTPLNPNRTPRTREQQREQDEFYTAIRLRQRRDPVQEYEESTLREARRLAHEKNKEQWLPIAWIFEKTPERITKHLSSLKASQTEEVSHILEGMALERSKQEARRKREYEQEDRAFQESIESTIANHEAELEMIAEERTRLERLAKEEEEARIRRAKEEAEAKARAAAQKAKEEAEKAALERKCAEEEAVKREAAEAMARKELEEAEAEAASVSFRPTTAVRELQECRRLMITVKSEILPQVKSTKLRPDITPNASWKTQLTKLRRQIVPKIGQVTNIRSEIQRITDQLHALLSPTPAHPELLYIALLYMLSKAFLKQAEEEVTAKPSTAFPLARVFVGLLEKGHWQLGNVFMAKLCQMSSHWVIGTVITREPGQPDEEYRLVLGQRPESSGETNVQYIERLGGLVTLYAAILQTPYQSTLSPEQLHQIPEYVRLSRLWTWIARLVNHPGLMADRAAPVILSCALETAGDAAMAAWGKQIAKLRSALGQKASEPEVPGNALIGGPDGKAGRIRLRLLLEKWVANNELRPEGRMIDS